MITEIKELIYNINLSYVVLSCLFLVVSLLFLCKKINKKFPIKIYIILYFVSAIIGLFKFNNMFNNVFNLNYISIKLYLILLIVGNIIMLITLNFKIKIQYKILNYMLFMTNVGIAIVNIIILITNKTNMFVIVKLSESIKLININFILFIFYLYGLFILYIVSYIVNIIKDKFFVKKEEIVNSNVVEDNVSNEIDIVEDNYIDDNFNEGVFVIDGIDCSAIFDDEDIEDSLKNYYILLGDVNAKLTNGYTIQEYTKIRDIMNKLNIKNYDLMNININELNKMSIDDYNLLKSYLKKNRKYE